MIQNLDLTVEDRRLANVQFDARPAEPRSVHVLVRAPGARAHRRAKNARRCRQSGLRDANLDQARQLYLAAVQQATADPQRASAYFGLGRIAAQQKDPETAEILFKKVLELQPEPGPKAWSCITSAA